MRLRVSDHFLSDHLLLVLLIISFPVSSDDKNLKIESGSSCFCVLLKSFSNQVKRPGQACSLKILIIHDKEKSLQDFPPLQLTFTIAVLVGIV